jgi:glutaredoxin
MHRAVTLIPRSILPTNTNTLPRFPVIKFAKRGYPVSRRVSPPLKFLALTTTMASASSSSSQQQQPSVAVVTTKGCPYCRQAKADLSAAGIPYTEILITDQLDVLNKIKETTGQSTVPQVQIFSRFFCLFVCFLTADSFRLLSTPK